MATKNDSSTPKNRYAVELDNAEDIAMQRLHQAWALSAQLFGEGFENFSAHSDEIQENTLWALHSMIDDARTALRRSQTRATAKIALGAA